MTRLSLIAVLVAGVLALVACGGGGEATPAGQVPTAELPTTPEPGQPAEPPEPPAVETEPPAPVEPEPPASTDPPAETFTYEVWLTSGESLAVVLRTAPKTPRVAATAVQSLLEGPLPEDGVDRLATAVPEGTTLLGVTVEDGVATVDLSSEYESGGGTLSMTMRLAQVVYTLTQFPTVEAVSFELDGQPVEVFSGEGIILDEPVTRADYEELLPIILVRQPQAGDRVQSPAHVEGIANVFEANVTVKILDADGNVIAEDFTTATCGTGCYGDYALDLAFDVDAEQPGTVVVHDDDAAGVGTPPHVVEIPVTLAP